jgi:hypothetical protein
VTADGDADSLYQEELEAIMALVDSLRRAGEAPAEDSRAVRVGPWLVYAPDHNGGGYPLSLVIVPDPAARAEDILYGITAGVLQKLRVGELRDRYREQVAPRFAARDWLAKYIGAASQRRRDDTYYAIASAAYAALTDAGDTSPLQTLADHASLPVGTVRSQIREARRRGMLTGVHGRPGGKLTELATGLLGTLS